MKVKLAVLYGTLIWIMTYILTEIISPILMYRLPDANLVAPIIIIIVTGFFGILYIRNINENEAIEGFLAGMIFIIIDIFLDYIFLLNLNPINLMFTNYQLHLFSTIVFTLLITTFLGYLAQMNIDLK